MAGKPHAYTAQIVNEDDVMADLVVMGNSGGQLFRGRVSRDLAHTVVSTASEELRAQELDQREREMTMDLVRSAKRELGSRLGVELD